LFTGIIESIGRVLKYDGGSAWIRLPLRRLALGESIAVDGVCLTVSARRGGAARFDIGPETARVTTLGALKPGDRVNVERALRAGGRLGGHWVTGHVEGTGRVVRVDHQGRNRWVLIEIPRALERAVVRRGSLAVDGISLTVAGLKGRRVRVMVIPHTLKRTTLSAKGPGDAVNIETDMLARYARKIYGPAIRRRRQKRVADTALTN